jgi:hypothetical protein
MPCPALIAPLAPTLTMRPSVEAFQMGQGGAAGVQRRLDVEGVHPVELLAVALDRAPDEAAGDVQQGVQTAEAGDHGLDRRLGLGRVGQVDAADLQHAVRDDVAAGVIDDGDGPAGGLRGLDHDPP